MTSSFLSSWAYGYPHSEVTFLIIRQGQPPAEPAPNATIRAGWTGKPEEWFKDTDEIAPGVKVKFLGYGDQLDKNRNAVHGALIAIWDQSSHPSSA